MAEVYDVAIIGAGPAGLAAGLYAGRARLSTVIIEQGVDGGQIAITSDLENYPGQKPEGESGPELIERFTAQAERFGCERVLDTVKAVELAGEVKTITCAYRTIQARSVIIATGATPRPIGCPGEKELTGRGVSYCATCDANFFQGLEVYVVGGGESAVEEAIYLTRFARKVTLIHRRDRLRAVGSVQERAFNTPNLHFMLDTVVESLGGDDVLSEMTVKNVKTGEVTKIEADEEDGLFGVFVFVGSQPQSGLFADQLELEWGYIKTDEDMRTNLPGVFAAGDIRVKSFRQVITAAADGAIAANTAEKYLAELDGTLYV